MQAKQQERTIILDACALKSQEAISIIKDAKKVIVLTRTIRELDNHKNVGGIEEKNIRLICRKIREDTESKKYVCTSKYDKYKYNDDNIIDYCKWHNDTIILTCDNNLCNMAKAYGINYIFPRIEENRNNKENGSAKKDYYGCNIKGVKYINGKLTLLRNALIDPNFKVILIRDGHLVKFSLNRNMTLDIGDIILRVKEKNESVDIVKYIIREIKSSAYAEYIENISLEEPVTNSIKKADLPIEVKNEVCLWVKGEPYEEKPKIDKEEIYLSKGDIFVRQGSYKTYIGVERNGTLIRRKNYTKGDYIYLAKANKKSLTLYVYRVVEKFNEYDVEKIDMYPLQSINAIYQLECSEELKDKIRNFYIHNIRF